MAVDTSVHYFSKDLRDKNATVDDGPLYDSVASEDDYSPVEVQQKLEAQKAILSKQKVSPLPPSPDSQDYQEVEFYTPGADWFRDWQLEEREILDEVTHIGMDDVSVRLEEYIEMKNKLESSEAKIKDLQTNNEYMRKQLDELSSTVQCLREENSSLRFIHSPERHCDNGVVLPTSSSSRVHSPYRHCNDSSNIQSSGNYSGLGQLQKSQSQRPASMFEQREGYPATASPSCANMSSSYSAMAVSGRCSSDSSCTGEFEPCSSDFILPSQSEVIRKTEVITKKIQELLISAQEGRHSDFEPCANSIGYAVQEMADIFPKVGCPDLVQAAVRQLSASAAMLQTECRGHVSSRMYTIDPRFVTQQVIQCAYDIAKTAKTLVTYFQ